MKISLNWLKEWIDYKETDAEKIAHILSDRASEVEEIIKQGEGLEKVFIGEILEITAHPDADRMRVTQTKVGDEIFQIVCGAKNIEVGQKVPVALVGAVLPGGFEIKKADKRGVESYGMICAKAEMGLADESEGIMVLPKDAPLGMPIVEYLGLDDTVFDIENTTITNRPDLFSHRGYVREFTALDLASWKDKNSFEKVETLQGTSEKFPLNITIDNPEICPRLCGTYIKNFKIAPSPDWMQKRLQACDIRPINNLVDITNYVMLEFGMPMHAFDLKSIDGTNVVMRTSKSGEKVTTLDGDEKELPENVIILEDEKKVFDLCGIMGGENSGVTNTTTDVWMHAPVYDPVRIRRASVALNHRTDASIIYEKRVPTGLAPQGLARAIELMKELCPECEVASEVVDIQNDKESSRSLTLTKKKLARVIGEELDETTVVGVLENLGFGVSVEKDAYKVDVPFFRFKDIAIEEDLVEEVARIYGLDKIEAELPEMKMAMSNPVEGFSTEQKIKNILAESAYENVNFSFLGTNLLENFGHTNTEELIEIANPLSEELTLMRPSLIPYLIEKAEHNKRHEEHFNIFEIGKIFSKNLEKREQKNLAYLGYNTDFYTVKAVLENLVQKLQMAIQIKPASDLPSYAHPGQVAEIAFQGKVIGYIATLHPQVAHNFGFDKNVVVFELNAEPILFSKKKYAQYEAFNTLPHSERDQNFVLEKSVLVGDFVKKLGRASNLLQNLEVVDVYEGEHVESGSKSVTLRAIYQASDRTLTDEEVDTAHKELVSAAEKQGAKLR